jgi:hypothetical protein
MRIDGRTALTLPEAARWLGLTVPCVSALVARGEQPPLRDPDGGVRIAAAALIEWAGSAERGGPSTRKQSSFACADKSASAPTDDGPCPAANRQRDRLSAGFGL